MSSNNNCANNECPHQQAECPAAEGCGGFTQTRKRNDITEKINDIIERRSRFIKNQGGTFSPTLRAVFCEDIPFLINVILSLSTEVEEYRQIKGDGETNTKLWKIIKEIEESGRIKDYFLHPHYHTGNPELNIEFVDGGWGLSDDYGIRESEYSAFWE